MSKTNLESIQTKLKVAIKNHQVLVTQRQIDPQNAYLRRSMIAVQDEIATLTEQQKVVVQLLRKQLVSSQAAVVANNTISPAHQASLVNNPTNLTLAKIPTVLSSAVTMNTNVLSSSTTITAGMLPTSNLSGILSANGLSIAGVNVTNNKQPVIYTVNTPVTSTSAGLPSPVLTPAPAHIGMTIPVTMVGQTPSPAHQPLVQAPYTGHLQSASLAPTQSRPFLLQISTGSASKPGVPTQVQVVPQVAQGNTILQPTRSPQLVVTSLPHTTTTSSVSTSSTKPSVPALPVPTPHVAGTTTPAASVSLPYSIVSKSTPGVKRHLTLTTPLAVKRPAISISNNLSPGAAAPLRVPQFHISSRTTAVPTAQDLKNNKAAVVRAASAAVQSIAASISKPTTSMSTEITPQITDIVNSPRSPLSTPTVNSTREPLNTPALNMIFKPEGATNAVPEVTDTVAKELAVPEPTVTEPTTVSRSNVVVRNGLCSSHHIVTSVSSNKSNPTTTILRTKVGAKLPANMFTRHSSCNDLSDPKKLIKTEDSKEADMEKQKLQYMASLNLITHDAVRDLQCRRAERKRRSTANPNYSSYHKTENENCVDINGSLTPSKRGRGRPSRRPHTLVIDQPITTNTNIELNGNQTPYNETPHSQTPCSPYDSSDDAPSPGIAGDVCNSCYTGGELLMCDLCGMLYHLGCIEPPLTAIPQGLWACTKCKLENKKSPTWPGTLTLVHAYIAQKSGKEDEKRRYQKRYEELKYDKSLLDKRASILADQLQHKTSQNAQLIYLGNDTKQSVRRVKAFLQLF